MIGTLLEKIFRSVYTIMKLNFMFWMLVFMGGVLFGVGPAFLSVSDLYVAHKYQYEDIKFTELHGIFRNNFNDGNKMFYLFGSLIFFVVYNLYLSFQLEMSWIVFMQILMVFTIVFLSITFLYTVVLHSYYEINFKDLLKLGFLSFFANIIQLVRFGISLVAIYFIFRLMHGLLLFGIFSLLILVSVESLSSWIPIINETIVYEKN